MAGEAKTKVVIDVGEGAKSMRSLKEEFKQAQKELDGLTVGSKQYVDQLKKLAAVKDDMEDLNKAITAFRPDQKLNAFVGAARGVAAGFEAATAASALFGDQAEEVEKTLLKVQSAMALANAVQEVGELGKQFKLLGQVVKSAFASNPFTAILVAVTALGALLGGVFDKYFSITALAKEEAEAQKKVVQAAQDKLSLIESSTAQLKLQGFSEEQILKIKQRQTDEVIEQTMLELQKQIQVQQAQQKTAEANKKILQGIIEFVTLPISVLLKGIDMVGKALGKEFNLMEKFSGGLAGMVFDPEEADKEGQKEIEVTLKNLQSLKEKRAQFELDLKDIKDKANKKALEDEKKAQDERLKLSEEEFRRRKMQLETEQAEEKSIEDLQKQIDDQAKADADAKLADDAARLNQSALDYEASEKKKTQDAAENAATRKQIQEAELSMAFSTVKGLTAISQILATGGKEMIAFQKGLAIAQIGIDTAQAISGTISNAIKAAKAGGPAAPYLAAAYIATGIATVLANVAQAKKILEQSAGGGGPALPSMSSGGGVPAPPKVNGVSNTSTLLDTGGGRMSEPKPLKAYVVETDVTSAQRTIQRIERKSKY